MSTESKRVSSLADMIALLTPERIEELRECFARYQAETDYDRKELQESYLASCVPDLLNDLAFWEAAYHQCETSRQSLAMSDAMLTGDKHRLERELAHQKRAKEKLCSNLIEVETAVEQERIRCAVDVTKLRAAVDAAEKALEPFAKTASAVFHRDDVLPVPDLTLFDFRRAEIALAALREVKS